ncbi:NADP-dependent phosphogluconate dehydrogenase [Candidatus Peregrinibacteria bacterium]|nr:NADP-dependent phosphogluconate dehydrogenase [Candidatus Peregrinibacteria bacterium]
MKTAQIGLIGLGVMGANLARNMASHKIRTLAYNRSPEVTKNFIKNFGSEFLDGEMDFGKFLKRLDGPRKLFILVKAGKPVDEVIENMLPDLKKNDILVDLGNSHYRDTIRREQFLRKKGIYFVGCGISGGEEGALHGPSLMPGGEKKAYKEIRGVFEMIAAKDFSGKPCVTFTGNDGAGHFVKMVHNGIEYGIMQIMAEAYDLLRKVFALSAGEIATVFSKWNKGKLEGYLFEIAANVLAKHDEFQEGFLVDFIMDAAEQKGTGKWVALDALERGVAIPTIIEAVQSRFFSHEKDERTKLSRIYGKKWETESTKQNEMLSKNDIMYRENYERFAGIKDMKLRKSDEHVAGIKDMKLRKNNQRIAGSEDMKIFLKNLEEAVYLSLLSTYIQGCELIKRASEEQNWNINLVEIVRVWEGGCVIRSRILGLLHKACDRNKKIVNHMLEIVDIKDEFIKNLSLWRMVIAEIARFGIPASGLSSALQYMESMTSENLPANFIQGLRDYFGAHAYQRKDKKGTFHTIWTKFE